MLQIVDLLDVQYIGSLAIAGARFQCAGFNRVKNVPNMWVLYYIYKYNNNNNNVMTEVNMTTSV